MHYIRVLSHIFIWDYIYFATPGIIYGIIEMKMAILTITMHSQHLYTTDYLRQYLDSLSE